MGRREIFAAFRFEMGRSCAPPLESISSLNSFHPAFLPLVRTSIEVVEDVVLLCGFFRFSSAEKLSNVEKNCVCVHKSFSFHSTENVNLRNCEVCMTIFRYR